MKRKITFFIAAVVMLLSLITSTGTMKGQDVTFSFTATENVWSLPNGSSNKTTTETTYTYGGYSIVLGGGGNGNGHYSATSGTGANNRYLINGKKDAYLKLPAFSFNVKKIKVYGNSAASSSTRQNIYVGSTAVSTETTGAQVDNIYVIDQNYQAAGNVYILKVTSAHNTQIKKIEVFQAYTVTYQAGDHGSGTMTDNNTYAVGDEVTLLTNSFTPAGGYEFSNWLVKDAEDHTITVTNNKFTMPASNVTITAQWAYCGPIQLATPTGFSATPGNAQIAFSWNEVEHASSYTISYTTDGESWTDIENIDETSYTKTGLSNNTEYTCKIKAAGDGSSYSDSEYSSTITATPTSATYYTISITSPITGGSVDSSVASATSGTTVTLTATPATGYGFNNIAASWSVIDSGDEPVSVTPGANNTATFTMPTSNVTVNATFIAYVVTLNAGTGTVNGNSTDTWTIATNDGNLPNAVSPNGDWSFGGWSTTQVSSETTVAPSYVATAYEPTSSITLYAVYTKTSNNDIETTLNVADYADDHNWSSGTQYTSASISPITFTITGGGNDGKYYNSDESWRIYSSTSGTITITTSGNNVHSVTSSPTRTFTISNGTASYSGSDTKFTSIVVTTRTVETSYYSNPLLKVATPNITLAAGTYTEVKTTTITCDTDQATIYYTTDGTVPSSTNGEEYTAAITIDESMTIKAIAVKDGMANSDVASKDYIINLPLTTMDAIYAKASENNGASKDVTVIFNNWVVSGVNGSTAYITDNAGKGFIIYKSGHGLAVNDKLNGTVSDTPLKLYNGAAQFTNISKTDLTVSDGSITVQTTTIADLSGVNTGAVITINNVKYDGTNLEDPSNSNIEIKPYNGLEYNPSFTNNHNYNVTGVYLQYNSTKEIMPRSAADVVEVEYDITLTQPQAGGTIGTQGDITTAKFGQEVTLTSTPADHYRFVLWTVMNGETPVAVNNNKFTMPKAPVTVTATFVQLYGITIDDDIENGTVSVVGDVTEAAENDNITLTITPEDGYALKTLTVYKTGDQSTTVSVSNNAFTMPAYAVTVTAEFDAEYTVTYKANGGTGDDVEDIYAKGTDVTVRAANTFTAPDGQIFVNWKTVASGEGTTYAAGATIENIQANIDLFAQWRDILYHVSFSVNGEIVSERNVAYNTVIGALPADPELAPLTFLGWSSTSATGATDVTASWKPTGENENVTVYAVFGTMGTGNFTIVANSDNTSNLPTSYTSSGDGEWKINNVLYFKHHYVMRGQNSINYYIQFKSDGGYFYNVIDFGKITSIVATYATGSGANASREIAIRINSEVCDEASDGEVMSVDNSGNVYTFTYDTDKKDYHYFRIYNSSTTSTLASVVIYYEAAAPVTINPISENESINNDGQLTANVTISSGVYYADEVITIPNGKTLTVSGTGVLVNDNPTNLVINDGGQLICSNSVAATVKKSIANANAKDAKDHWYTISAPVHTDDYNYVTIGNETTVNLTNNGAYDMFAYEESTHTWLNQKNNGEANGFDKMYAGQGYIYRNSGNELSYVGNTTVGPVNIALSYTSTLDVADLKGFNLIGNPYTHSIAKGSGKAIDNTKLSTGCYALTNSGTWTIIEDGNEIKPNQGVLVEVSETVADFQIKDINYVAPTPDPGKYKNDNIKFIVESSEYSDAAYAWFDKGIGLTKINHRNENAPMLYIPQDDNNYAIATMTDDTKAFNLNFKAATAGKYTLSYKATGDYNYLHVIDRMTGEDVDMLLEGEYSFIGTPNDNVNRFIVKLGYNAGNEISENEIFAYQSGNDIVVSGEGELQVFDVMGRMVMTQRINGVETINIPTNGMYIFRLNEKVQKIVVE